MCQIDSRARRAVAAPLKSLLVFSALFFVLTETASAIDLSIGPKEVIYSKKQRKKLKLSTWPDGNLGVVPNADGSYDFYGANGRHPVKTTGSLDSPGKSRRSVSITGLPKKTFNYVAGGPIYQDPTSGARLMVYHAETHGKSAKDYYSMLGMAVSTDPNGRQFRDLGIVVQPNMPGGQAEITGGAFAVMGDYFHLYYKDLQANGAASELAVARAPISELISNALSGQSTDFTKYYNGDWTEPGIGGKASALEVGNPSNLWTTISYSEYLDELVMVNSVWNSTQPDLYLTTSSDGINWSPRQAIVTDPGEQFYPTLIGTGNDPTHSDQSLYLYYTDSQKGAFKRWKDAQLVRREITFDPYSTADESDTDLAIVPEPVPPPDPPAPGPVDWANVASFGTDFQTGGPAEGWQYMWNPKGKRNVPSTFAPLEWSDSANAYNTTGGATPEPHKKKKHRDDYLTLHENGGHPGRKNRSPIAGYTIQEEDGNGLYRLADTSIQKADSIAARKEDGLGVLVYVNDTLLGPIASVATDGLPVSFDRELGELSVGDTVWVMVESLKNQSYDSFINFDFSIQKSFPVLAAAATQGVSQLTSAVAVPEPHTATFLIAALAGGGLTWRRRTR
jgi:hypothetical protein